MASLPDIKTIYFTAIKNNFMYLFYSFHFCSFRMCRVCFLYSKMFERNINDKGERG